MFALVNECDTKEQRPVAFAGEVPAMTEGSAASFRRKGRIQRPSQVTIYRQETTSSCPATLLPNPVSI